MKIIQLFLILVSPQIALTTQNDELAEIYQIQVDELKAIENSLNAQIATFGMPETKDQEVTTEVAQQESLSDEVSLGLAAPVRGPKNKDKRPNEANLFFQKKEQELLQALEN